MSEARKLRDGRSVEIIAILPVERALADNDRIIGITTEHVTRKRFVRSWRLDGRHWADTESGADIIDPPRPLEVKP